MHAAICDDNVGDRKQLERLLSRESDRRALTSGVLYIDSFGNSGALMQSPILYDAYFIDMAAEGQNGAVLALQLIERGITSPIVLCCSQIDYRREIASHGRNLNDKILFLDKPIIKEELAATLNYLVKVKASSLPRIELREEKETRYVTEDDIVYAHANGIYVTVHVRDGSMVNVLSSVDNFFAELAQFQHYYAISGNSMVNIIYVQKASMFSLSLKDGTALKMSPSYASDIKRALKNSN